MRTSERFGMMLLVTYLMSMVIEITGLVLDQFDIINHHGFPEESMEAGGKKSRSNHWSSS